METSNLLEVKKTSVYDGSRRHDYKEFQDVCETVQAMYGTGGNNQPIVVQSVTAYSFDALSSNSMKSKNPISGCRSVDVSRTIDTTSQDPSKNQGGIAIVTEITYGLDRASFNQGVNAKYDFSVEEEKMAPLLARGPGAVGITKSYQETTGTLMASGYDKLGTQEAMNDMYITGGRPVVRRLTPKECERLQGFPDDYTNIGDWVDSKGKKHKGDADSPRYKALGNSIALPPWRYVLRRLSNHCGEDKSMGSLFDGIGGFPLIWREINGEENCKWASEIDEFPIAVTNAHFKKDE